ncbi:unnamed protein product [Vicia faba]|uniref:AB hydrolase-1 domain-containing protein n=1 Tax=Vicia faba TaxID=3906 RepID=A0AAV1ACB4_VICFA|nr:unnamed protein product [Vicia faba]
MMKRDMHFVHILFLLTLSPLICVSGKHFVLVHGACHGAWCWFKVATLLKSAGHNVTLIEMAASGRYQSNTEEKVVLVGHSLAGLSMSVAMEKFPEKISVAVFITAFVLSQNLTYPAILQEQSRRNHSIMDTKDFYFDGPNKPATARLFGPKYLASTFYQLSPPEDLTLALSLARPMPLYNDYDLLLKETAVTYDRNGRVPKVFIIGKKDKLVSEDFQRWIIERSGPYAEVRVIRNADHMVIVSKPRTLTSLLLRIASKPRKVTSMLLNIAGSTNL